MDMSQLAASYDEKRRMPAADLERLLGLIERHGRVKGHILEVGCGTGFYLVHLAQRFPAARLYGLEPSDAMLSQARRKVSEFGLAKCLLAKGDGHSLPFRSGAFDFVLMSQVLHFFGDRQRAAAEVRRVTRSDARLLVITTSHPQLRAQVDLGFFPGLARRDIARIPSIAEIRRMFEGHGFELRNTIEFATTFEAASADALVEQIKRNPWSSYLLFTEDEFSRRLKGFRRKLRDAFGDGELSYLVPQTLLFFRKT
jgi:ubiquinone/menaquinone biosynthesis C-methylase UbiE